MQKFKLSSTNFTVLVPRRVRFVGRGSSQIEEFVKFYTGVEGRRVFVVSSFRISSGEQ